MQGRQHRSGSAFEDGTACDRLIHDGERVAHRSITSLSQSGQSIIFCLDVFLCSQIAELAHNLVKSNRVKAEVLAARTNRLRNVFRLRCSHHEDNVAGRFLESLQQRVKSSVGNLMRFVQNVDLVAITGWAITCSIAQFADLVDTTICRRINFDYIDRTTGTDLLA